MAAKYKKENLARKIAADKERDMQHAEKMLGDEYHKLVRQAQPPEEPSYKDKYRSGWHSGVKEKCY